MDFTQEIKARLDAGEDWTAIAESFTNSMNLVHQEREQVDQEVKKVEAIRDALKVYYGGEMDAVLDKWTYEDMKSILDNFKELYDLFDNLTFPLKK